MCDNMPAMNVIVDCEGKEQRIVPTGVATGDNEIKQRRNFSETHFLGVAPCGFCWDRHDGNVM